jgi:hypothetical protein
MNAETSATRAARHAQGHARIAETHRGVSARSFISNSPTGTAERTAETLEVRDRQFGRPGGGVIMAMDRAVVGAAASGGLRC